MSFYSRIYLSSIVLLKLFLIVLLNLLMDSHVFGYEPTEENVTEIQESSSVPNSEELYNNAYLEFTRGNYDSAVQGFREYIRLFLNSELTDNAQYWIGESYYAQKDWQNALIEFKRVEKIYPKSNKIQAVLYKIGDCYLKLEDNKRAEDYFKKVIESFPNSPEAQMAKEKLEKKKPMITATVEVKNNNIMITSASNGVNIYLDDKNKGTTPMQLKGVSFGSHIIRLSCTGYQDYTEKFRIEELPSAPLTEAIKLYTFNEYNRALEFLTFALAQTRDYNTKVLYAVEIGDIYLDKLRDYAKAESTYKAILSNYPKFRDFVSVIYRLGITLERQERFLDAAQAYEQVATKYSKTPYSDDALGAIERCFKKNYQDLVAKVNGYPISRIEFDDRINQNPNRYENIEDKINLLNDMIDERLLYVDAMKRNLENNPEVAAKLTEIRNNILFQEWYNQEVSEKVKGSEKEKQIETEKRFNKVTGDLKKKYNVFIDTIALKLNKETLGVVDNLPVTNTQLQERLAKIPPFYRQEFETSEGKKRIVDQIVLEQILLREVEEQNLWLSNKFISQFEPKRVSTLTFFMRKQETTEKVKIFDKNLKKEYSTKSYTKPFEEVKEKIEQKLLRQKEEQLYQQLVTSLRAQAKIEKFATNTER